MESGEDRWALQINSHTRVQWKQNSCVEHSEDGKWALCMHTCAQAPDTHTFEGLQNWVTNPQTLNTPPLLLLGGYFIFVQNPSIGHLSHTNSTPPVLDGTALQQQFSILGWPTGSSPLHLSICVLTYMHNTWLTRAHNPANKVSGVDSKSLWGAYPGVLSDTPMHWVCYPVYQCPIPETNSRNHAL